MALPKILLGGQCVCVALMLIGLLGQRTGLLPFKAAFGGFALGLLGAAIIGIIALVVLLLSLGIISSDNRAFSGGAFVLGAIPLLLVVSLVGAGFKVPKIHDISTNLDENIAFLHAHTLRSDGENSLEFPSDKVISAHRAHYTTLEPLVVADSPSEAYQKARKVALSLGWEVFYENDDALQFEALEKTAMFGFVDDIAIRVQPIAKGSVIDTRSVSRVGVSDLGANARRIQRFQEAYKLL